MSAILCPVHINCPGSDFPISNYSSEGPEQVPTYYALVFPDSWEKQGCLKLCTSTISQEDANLCALAQAAQCNPPTIFFPPGEEGGDEGGGGGGGGGTSDPIYYNVAQDCLVACPDGREFTVVIPAGTFSAKTQLAADARAEAYACLLAKANFICIGELDNPGMCVGSNYLETVEITIPSGNFPTVVSVINGALPPGITLDYTDTNFTLLGTPTSAGQYDFTVFVEDVLGNSMEKPFSLFVIEITQDTLPDGIVGSAYSQTMTLTGPTSGAVTWAVTAGFLPPGLTLNASTGLLSGTPTSQGSATFTISGTDER